jgi:GntR family transcriptional regulator, galactonate operon transcriptional repressor
MTSQTQAPRATFQEQVLEALGKDICMGRVRPGQVLPPEAELCQRFGFSRIVIREAIKSLAAKGLLEVSRRVGTLVLEPTRWNLFDPDIIGWRAEAAMVDPTLQRDLMEMRRIIEPAAVRLAALRASSEERRNLRSAYMAMVRAVAGKGDYVKADLEFHTIILSACGNQFVRQMQDAMAALLRVSFDVITQKPGGPAHSLPMHEAVCEAIERGDAQAAERAALILIDAAEEDLRELVPVRTTDVRAIPPVATSATSSALHLAAMVP